MGDPDQARAGEAAMRGRGVVGGRLGVGATLWVAVRDPVVPILLLAGFFDGISGNPIHSILLFSVGIALGRDAVLRRRGTPVPERAGGIGVMEDVSGPGAAIVLVIVGVAFAMVVGGFGRYSWPATIAIVIPGALALALVWRGPIRPRSEIPPVQRVGAAAWVSVFVALSLWELQALLLQPSLTTDSYAHPTISVLSDPLLASHPGRSISLFVWLAFGWFLVQR